jgi:hypothetical protein
LNKHDVVMAIAKSIQLYKNAETMEKSEILKLAREISELNIFSNRQIEKMAHNRITHLAIGKVTGKTTKNGGKLNPASLELIRELIFEFSDGKINWEKVGQVVRMGTSQSLVSKLTGISKTQINRRFVEKSI